MNFASSSNLKILMNDNFDIWYDQLRQVLYANKIGYLLQDPQERTGGSKAADDHELSTDQKASADGQLKAQRAGEDGEQAEAKAIYLLNQTIGEDDQRYVLNQPTLRGRVDLLRSLRAPRADIVSLIDRLQKLRFREPVERFIGEIDSLRAKMKSHPSSPSQDDAIFIQKLLKSLPADMKYTKNHYERELRQDRAISWAEISRGVADAYRDIVEERKERPRPDRRHEQGGGFHFANVAKCWGCNSISHKVNQCPKRQREPNSWSRFEQATRGRGRGRGRGGGRGGGQCGAPGSGRSEGEECERALGSAGLDHGQGEVRQQSGGSANLRAGQRGALAAQAVRNRPPERVQNFDHNDAEYLISSESFNVIADQAARPSLAPDQFIYDDGSDKHVVNRLEFFKSGEYRPFSEPLGLMSINGGQALGIGTVAVISVMKKQEITFNLKNVLYIPTCKVNIFSECAALDNGLRLTVGEDQHFNYKGLIAPNGERILTARRPRGLARNGHFITSLYVNRVAFNLIATEWHDVLGCAAYDRIYNTAPVVTGMKIEKTDLSRVSCVNCIEAKSTRRTFRHKLLRENVRGRVWHSDICELPIQSRTGSRYFIVFVDEASRYVRVYFLKSVGAKEVWEAINSCITDQMYDIDSKPQRLHTDKGGAYLSEYVQSRLAKLNIKHTDATAGNHEQNGLAEKTIRDIMNVARAMLMRYNCPDVLWEQSVANAVYAMNRTWKRTIQTCPFALMFGYKPDVGHMKPFGCPVYLHIEKERRGRAQGKLARRAKLMRFVGHTNSSVVFLVTDRSCTRIFPATNLHFLKEWPVTNRVLVQDVTKIIPSFEDDSASEPESEGESVKAPRTRAASGPAGESGDHSCGSGARAEWQRQSTPIEEQSVDLSEQSYGTAGDRTVVAPDAAPVEAAAEPAEEPGKMKKQFYDYLIDAKSVTVPSGYKQIANNDHAEMWYEAADTKFLQYIEFETWELVPEPVGQPVLNGHWRFDLKEDQHGFVEAFKARWVVDGSELPVSKYAPVVDLPDMRLITAYAARRGYLMHTVDVDNAYLNSALPDDEVVYMKQVTGYVDPARPKHVCRLKKSLFGLPTSAHNWFETLSTGLQEIDLIPSRLAPCIFYSPNLEQIVAAHVDDLLLACDGPGWMSDLKEKIRSRFPIKDHGQIRTFLGMEYEYHPKERLLRFKQSKKIRDVYGLLRPHCPKANKLPIQPSVDLNEPSPPFEDVNLYMRGLGSINYIATCTRPDLAVYSSQLARHMKSPTKLHFRQLCQCVSYLNATENYALTYRNDDQDETDERVYVLADAGELGILGSRGKRTTGLVCVYNRNLIHWVSKRQTVVTSDICHAELYSINAGLRLGLAFRNLLAELGVLASDEQFKVPVLSDSGSAIQIVQPEGEEQKKRRGPRHYDLAMLYVNDYVDRNECELGEIASSENVADLMTKFVNHGQFGNLWPRLGLEPFGESGYARL